jgi:hypothetical protein
MRTSKENFKQKNALQIEATATVDEPPPFMQVKYMYCNYSRQLQ